MRSRLASNASSSITKAGVSTSSSRMPGWAGGGCAKRYWPPTMLEMGIWNEIIACSVPGLRSRDAGIGGVAEGGDQPRAVVEHVAALEGGADLEHGAEVLAPAVIVGADADIGRQHPMLAERHLDQDAAAAPDRGAGGNLEAGPGLDLEVGLEERQQRQAGAVLHAEIAGGPGLLVEHVGTADAEADERRVGEGGGREGQAGQRGRRQLELSTAAPGPMPPLSPIRRSRARLPAPAAACPRRTRATGTRRPWSGTAPRPARSAQARAAGAAPAAP